MNSWELIKGAVRRESTREGSTGELVDINNASKVYMAIRDKLKDREKADKAFNNDPLVTSALLNRNFLDQIGIL